MSCGSVAPNRSWLRIAKLWLAVVVAALLVRPFPTARSDAEAAWAALQLTDAVEQTERGLFPVYIGQTDAIPDGTPHAGAPVHQWSGVALHFLTLRRYAPADINWLLAAIGALGGLCAAYFGLREVLGGYPRLRLMLAAGYMTASGLLWQFGSCSETAFAAVPYAPLLLLALSRGATRPDGWAMGGTALLLALLWMTHAPTGLTATALTAAWIACCWRPALRPALRTAVLFALLSAWFFAGAGVLGVFPVRLAWLTDQCAVPAALVCAAAALWLKHLLTTDRWEFALAVTSESGASDTVLRCGPAALAALGIAIAIAAGLVLLLGERLRMGPTSGEPTERAEPRSLLPRPPQIARADQHLSVDDPLLSNELHPKSGEFAARLNGAGVPFRDESVRQPERPAAGYVPVHARDVPPILTLRVEPGKRYVLTLEYWTKNYRGAVRLKGDTVDRTVPLPEDSAGVRGLRLFVCDESAPPQLVEVSVVGKVVSAEQGSGWYCGPVGLAGYRFNELPIQVRSLAPYTTTVRAEGDGVLITHRRFVPGYRVLINGRPVKAFASADGRVAVLLSAGANEVRLQYRGTVVMRGAFVVSVLTACGLAVAALWSGWRRSRVRNARGEPDVAVRLAA